jgi:hypothetical protein
MTEMSMAVKMVVQLVESTGNWLVYMSVVSKVDSLA